MTLSFWYESNVGAWGSERRCMQIVGGADGMDLWEEGRIVAMAVYKPGCLLAEV